MTMSKVNESEERDQHEPIKRLDVVHMQAGRNRSKQFTSFCIKDILGSGVREPGRSQHSFSVYHRQSPPLGTDIPLGQASAHKNVTKDGKHDSLGETTHLGASSHSLHRELLNLCRLDKARLGQSPALRSNPGCFRLSHSRLSHRHAEHREQHSQHTLPIIASSRIVRPWDNELDPLPRCSNMAAPASITHGAVGESSSDEHDEEINVDDDEQSSRVIAAWVCSGSKSVSPLDALMAMTSKTFEGLDGGGPKGECTINRQPCSGMFVLLFCPFNHYYQAV